MQDVQDEPLFAERVAGLDIAKAVVEVTIRVPSDATAGRRQQETRTFATTRRELESLEDWLACWGVTKVGMEATGDYWKPVFFLLESRGFDCQLYNAAQVKALPGRPKTDRADSIWLARITERGSAASSFVPPEPIRRLRTHTRYRRHLTQARTAEKQRVEKLLEDGHLKLSSVISDIHGVSGRDMLDAIATVSARSCWALPTVPNRPTPMGAGHTPGSTGPRPGPFRNTDTSFGSSPPSLRGAAARSAGTGSAGAPLPRTPSPRSARSRGPAGWPAPMMVGRRHCWSGGPVRGASARCARGGISAWSCLMPVLSLTGMRAAGMRRSLVMTGSVVPSVSTTPPPGLSSPAGAAATRRRDPAVSFCGITASPRAGGWSCRGLAEVEQVLAAALEFQAAPQDRVVGGLAGVAGDRGELGGAVDGDREVDLCRRPADKRGSELGVEGFRDVVGDGPGDHGQVLAAGC
jgi:hypothetical protein